MTDSLQRRNGSPVPPTTETGPTILGFPAEVAEDGAAVERPTADLDSIGRLVVLRRADPVGCSLLFLAGVATNVSLWLPWVAGDNAVGLALVGRGVDALGSGFDEWSRGDQWQPLAVVIGGGLLLLLGALLLVPAHAHRSVGVLALVVALATGAAVLDVLADHGWQVDRLAVGLWFAGAVPVLGVLGALKAMLTAPRATIAPRESGVPAARV